MQFYRIVLAYKCLTKDLDLVGLLYENYKLTWKYRNSVRIIESYLFRKRVRRNRLIKKSDPEKIILI